MNAFENKGGKELPPLAETKEKDVVEQLKLKDQMYSKMRPFKVLVPIELSLKSIMKSIKANLK